MKTIIILFALLFIQLHAAFAQTKLDPGDIQFIAFRADSPDGFSVVVWRNIEDSTEICFTDNGWAATDSIGFTHQTENSIRWINTSGGTLPAGTVLNFFCQGNTVVSNLGSTVGSLCGLSSSGDQIFAFQGTLDSCTVIAGINFEGNAWQNDRLNANTSAEPHSIKGSLSSLAIPEIDNARCMAFRFGHPSWQYQIWNSDLHNSWIFDNDGNNVPDMDTTHFTIVGSNVRPESGPDSIWIVNMGPRAIKVCWSDLGIDGLTEGYLVRGFAMPNQFRPMDLYTYPQDNNMVDFGATVTTNSLIRSVLFQNIPPDHKYVFSVTSFGLGGQYPFYNREDEKRIVYESLEETMDVGLSFQDSTDNGSINNSSIPIVANFTSNPKIQSTSNGQKAVNLRAGDRVKWELRSQTAALLATYSGEQFYWTGSEDGLVVIHLFVNDRMVDYRKVYFD
jgi:hypothetical protein